MAEELARELEICDDVRFVGKQQDMEEIYAISDLFLLPSEYESFGLAALEAMAGGAPVISSNAGGLPEIIEPGVNGFMSPVGDVEQMSEQAIRILKDDATLQQFRTEARKQAERFDIMNIVPQYEELYARFVKDNALAR
jgi:glycosyltransferase involved in cell wall biosynthesis